VSERILVIEDDPSILRGLQLNLTLEGYSVRSATDGETGLQLARAERFDLLVVDVMLPRLGGLELIRELRRDDPDLAGLQLGADDYMVKPFSLKELLARIGALLRRRRVKGESGQERTVKKVGPVEIDLQARRATANGRPLELTTREFDLLLFFISHPDRVFSREQLMESVWGSRYFGTARTVDNFVARLRAHIDDDAEAPRHLETVRGVGYRFNR
jgi:DNA-binding response OmpR family regulator